MPKIADILQAMRADSIPSRSAGLWTVNRIVVDEWRQRCLTALHGTGDVPGVPPLGTYTHLWCLTENSLNRVCREFPGENVMNDFPYELKKHLQFIMAARGRVLVTGLGLGCVVRGLLAAGRVQHVDVVERSAEVISLCADSVADPRVTIHKMDARHELPPGRYDFAWHDLFSADDEPHLQVIHMELFARLSARVAMQGAWAMPRRHRRALAKTGGFF